MSYYIWKKLYLQGLGPSTPTVSIRLRVYGCQTIISHLTPPVSIRFRVYGY